MKVDERVSTFFNGQLKQVFVYLTSRCQLRCRQCLYKPLLTSEYDDLSFDTLSELLSIFKNYGAFKLSFLGGEPTLYCDPKTGKTFSDIVVAGKQLGYTLVRADTNGQFDEKFLLNEKTKQLDELTFSLDGNTSEVHDAIRRKIGAFQNCINRIRQAVELGYRVQITSCVHRNICGDVETGVRQIEEMIRLCDSLGVHSLNFHPILKVGIARDNWIDNTEIEPEVWLTVYRQMINRLAIIDHNVDVRLPMRYIESDLAKDEHNYCPLRMGERVLIMPDGQLKICAFNIGTPYCFARFNCDSIEYELVNNEYERVDKQKMGCSCQVSPNGLSALCMSYKPNQNEAVWNVLKKGGAI